MKRAKETFTHWDAAEHLDSEKEIAAYLQACADEDDPQLMIAALGDVARARGIPGLAKKTGSRGWVCTRPCLATAIPATPPSRRLRTRWV